MNALVQFDADAATRALLDEMTAGMVRESGLWALPRALSRDERAVLAAREKALTTALRPSGMASADGIKVGAAVGAMLAGYPALRVDRVEAQKMIAVYAKGLADLPLFAIDEACSDIARGVVEGVKAEFPVPVPQLHQIADQRCEALRNERGRLTRILDTKRIAAPTVETSPEVRKKLGDLMAGLASKLQTATSRADAAERGRLENEALARNEQTILREYAALGVEPKRGVNGRLISPSLLRNIQGKRFVDMMPARSDYDDEGC